MATSYAIYKPEITGYLKRKFNRNAKVLDVGAGEGTYYNYLHDYFTNIEAVEVFKPNIDNFELEKKYSKVYNIDIKDFKYDFYDIIIFGDIIEHLDVNEAKKVLKYAYNRCNEMIVAVPYLNPQGIEEDNVYEIHKQDDLTDELVKERYPYLKNIYKDQNYGYYIKEVDLMKNYIVKALFNFNDVEEKMANGADTPRKINDVFECTKERYEFLKSKNAVMLVGINEFKPKTKEELEIINDEEKNTKAAKKKTSKN